MTRLRAISLWQPWASAIAVGVKNYETRSWSTKHRGWIAIHAAKRWGREIEEAYGIERRTHPELPETPPLGAIVAVAVLSTVWRTEDRGAHITEQENFWGDWSPGRFAWELQDVHALPDPLPVKGRQGLWTLTEEETEKVWAQVRK